MLVTALLIGIFGVLCIALGVLIGKGLGRTEEFRDAQRTTEVMQFTLDEADELKKKR